MIATDVEERWWSTHDSVERFLLLKPALQHMVTDGQLDKSRVLSEEHCTELKLLLKILRPLKDAQEKLEGEKYVTINWIILLLLAVSRALDTASTGVLSKTGPELRVAKLAAKMRDDFQTRWGTFGDDFFTSEVRRG